MKTPRPQLRVQSRLLRVFVLQLAIISVLTVAGVLAASWVAERILVNEALQGEADYFWQQRDRDSLYPLPGTQNLTGYMETTDVIPQLPPLRSELQGLALGQQRVAIEGRSVIAHVSERGPHRLVLLFQEETVSNLGFYFGVVPLTLVLLLMYSLAFFAYWMSKRAVSPIAKLADTIEKFNFSERDSKELDLAAFREPQNSETLVLADALQHFMERTQVSIERERNFVRYASHELRTPLAVIQGSVSSLELAKLEGAPKRALNRIDRAGRHMNDLIATLLMLARDVTGVEPADVTSINSAVDELVAELKEILPEKITQVSVAHAQSLSVKASDATIRIVLGNILRNACIHGGNGGVTITIADSVVSIQDRGPGLSDVDQIRIFEPFYRTASSASGGHGLGLALVSKTCENFGWELNVDSDLGVGSTFSIDFGQSVART